MKPGCAASYRCRVANLYIFDPSGGPENRARREAERAERRALVRARYAQRVASQTGLDEITADLVMATLSDHVDDRGEECGRGNHPKLPDDGEWSHDAGFDCPCTWDAGRRELERAAAKAEWEEYQASPEAEAQRRAEDAEFSAIEVWIAAHPGVTADRTVLACPEVWEGGNDRRPFVLLPRAPWFLAYRDRSRAQRHVRQPARRHLSRRRAGHRAGRADLGTGHRPGGRVRARQRCRDASGVHRGHRPYAPDARRVHPRPRRTVLPVLW